MTRTTSCSSLCSPMIHVLACREAQEQALTHFTLEKDGTVLQHVDLAPRERYPRRDWLLGIARAISFAADCSRRQVGCVIYDPVTFHLHASGYNGRAAGLPGCKSEGACPRGQMSYAEVPSGIGGASRYDGGAGKCDAIHAEDNALRRARALGLQLDGMHAVVTAEPCEPCTVLLRHYGITRAIWPEGQTDL